MYNNTIVEQSALKHCGCGEAVSDRRRVRVVEEDEGCGVADDCRALTVSDHVSACAGCGELRPGGGSGGMRAIVAAMHQATAPRLRPRPHRAASSCRG